jgi:hypothetical protein
MAGLVDRRISRSRKLPMPCSRNIPIILTISSPLSILLWPAQKIMCQKRLIFSWSWRGLLIIEYTHCWTFVWILAEWL